MNEHFGFHNKEHHSTNCPKCRQSGHGEQKDNLLTEIAQLRGKCDMSNCQHTPSSWECSLCFAGQVLTKAREAVEGAGLTTKELESIPPPTGKEVLDFVDKNYGGYMSELNRIAAITALWQIKTAKAQTKAILKALGVGEK